MRSCVVWLVFLPCISIGQSLYFPDQTLLVERVVPGQKWQDPFSANADPASLAGYKELGAAVYSEWPYGLKELARYHLAMTLPIKNNAMSVGLVHQGGQLYRKTDFRWGLGYKLGRVDLGVQLHFSRSKFLGYKPKQFITPTVAIRWQIKENWLWAVLLQHFIPGIISGDKQDRHAMQVRSVNSFIFSENVAASLELNYIKSLNPAFLFQIFYLVASRCDLSGGYESRNGKSWIRAGWKWNALHLFTGVELHPQLGMSNSFGLIMNFHKSNTNEE